MNWILEKANPWLHDLVSYIPGKPIEDVARELGLEPSQIVKLASNENPIGPSPLAVQAMQEALQGDDSNLVAALHALIKLTISLFDEFATEAQATISVAIDSYADEVVDGVDWDEFPR